MIKRIPTNIFTNTSLHEIEIRKMLILIKVNYKSIKK